MAKRRTIFTLDDFSGGMSTSQPLTKMQSKFSKLLLNCHLSADGGISKNPGYQRLNTVRTILNLTGTVNIVQNSAVVTGVGTLFLTEIVAGQEVLLVSLLYRVRSVESDAQITLTTNIISKTQNNNNISSPVLFTSGISFKDQNNAQVLLTSGSGNIFGHSPVGLTGNDMKIISPARDKKAKFYFAVFNTVVYFANGVDRPFTIPVADLTPFLTETTNSITTTDIVDVNLPTTAFRPYVYKNRLWWLDKVDKNLTLFSALNNGLDYTTPNNAGFLDFKSVLPEVDILVDISSKENFIIFHFENTTLVYSGSSPADLAISQIIQGIGVVATDTVKSIGNEVNFIYTNGVKNLKAVAVLGSLNTAEVSNEIEGLMVKLIKVAGSTATNYSSAHFPERSWYMIQIGKEILIYNYAKRAWGRVFGADVSTLFSTSDGKVFIGGAGYVYSYGVGFSFDGEKQSIRWDTLIMGTKTLKRLHPKLLTVINDPNESGFTGTQSEVSIAVNYDAGLVTDIFRSTYTADAPVDLMDVTPESPFSSSFFLDSGNFEPKRVPLFGTGKLFNLVITESSVNGPLEFSNLVIEALVGEI